MFWSVQYKVDYFLIEVWSSILHTHGWIMRQWAPWHRHAKGLTIFPAYFRSKRDTFFQDFFSCFASLCCRYTSLCSFVSLCGHYASFVVFHLFMIVLDSFWAFSVSLLSLCIFLCFCVYLWSICITLCFFVFFS